MTCTGDSDQDHPHGKEMQKAKWLSGEALQIALKRREVKSKGEKERYKHLNRYQGNISCKDGLDKGQKWYGTNRSRRY